MIKVLDTSATVVKCYVGTYNEEGNWISKRRVQISCFTVGQLIQLAVSVTMETTGCSA